MSYITPGRDPLGHVEWLIQAKRFPFTAKIPEGRSWQGFRMDMNRQLEDYFTGMFDIVLGDEAKLKDDSAEYVLYVDPEEETKALEYLKRYKISG